MLTLDAINAEIAEVIAHGDNRNDVAHLASLFICRDKLSELGTTETPIKVVPETNEFMACVNGKCYSSVIAVIDELMSVLQATNQRLYRAVINKLMDT